MKPTQASVRQFLVESRTVIMGREGNVHNGYCLPHTLQYAYNEKEESMGESENSKKMKQIYRNIPIGNPVQTTVGDKAASLLSSAREFGGLSMNS
jgi:hypothetical protein